MTSFHIVVWSSLLRVCTRPLLSLRTAAALIWMSFAFVEQCSLIDAYVYMALICTSVATTPVWACTRQTPSLWDATPDSLVLALHLRLNAPSRSCFFFLCPRFLRLRLKPFVFCLCNCQGCGASRLHWGVGRGGVWRQVRSFEFKFPLAPDQWRSLSLL